MVSCRKILQDRKGRKNVQGIGDGKEKWTEFMGTEDLRTVEDSRAGGVLYQGWKDSGQGKGVYTGLDRKPMQNHAI